MKKKIIKYILVLLIILHCHIVEAKPANEAFDDDIFYKCVIDAYNGHNEHVDYNHNLTDEELEKITRLNCDNSSSTPDSEKITSVSGLEKLTNLAHLDLEYNNLSEINVSENTELTYLNLNYNKINEIDVSSNTKLTELRIRWNKLLSKIDVSANTQLTYLNLGYNNLSEIDVSANTELTHLILSENKLREIDVSKNTELTFLDLDQNNLSKIDVSKNTELAFLDLCINRLSKIDVSANTQLTYLNLWGNNLSTIDVSKNTELTELDLSDTNLSSIDLSKNTELTNLDLCWNSLSEIDVSKNTKLTNLYLTNNNLSTIDLSSNTKLKYLQLKGNHLLSLNIDNQKNLNFSIIYDYVNFSPQARTINPIKENNKYIIDLKEYDSNLNPSKVELSQEGIEYDNKTGIISFTTIPQTIKYTYITDKEMNMDVEITVGTPIENEPKVETPVIKEFYIGGKSNPDKIKSNKTSIYLSWEDENITKYCINEENNSNSCKWIDVKGKEITTDYTFKNENGEKVLYAYIKNADGIISNVKEDKVIIEIPLDEPLPTSPQTGGYTIGVILTVGIVTGIYYKYYLSKKDKLKEI